MIDWIMIDWIGFGLMRDLDCHLDWIDERFGL